MDYLIHIVIAQIPNVPCVNIYSKPLAGNNVAQNNYGSNLHKKIKQTVMQAGRRTYTFWKIDLRVDHR